MATEIREAFEAAFAEAEENQINTPEPAPAPEAPPPEAPALEGKPEATESAPPEAVKTTPSEPAPGDGVKTPPAADKTEKAPASWSATAREKWGQLPPEARQEVMKRERQVNEVLQQSATARHALQELTSVLAPHRERMQANGVENPLQMIGTMLDAERRLSSGDPQTRAATIANLIKGYGVDIGVLDSLLAGENIAPSPAHDIERIIEQRLAPVNQFLQQQQAWTQQQQYQQQQQIAQTVNEFSTQAEFIEDVRLDMADLLDMAAARGQAMTLEQAYHKACAIHPEVSKVIAERQRQQSLMGTQNALSHKKNAAVSITGTQRGLPSNTAHSLRDQIAAAWDEGLN